MKRTIIFAVLALGSGFALGRFTATYDPANASPDRAAPTGVQAAPTQLATTVEAQRTELAQRDRREIELINQVDALERELAAIQAEQANEEAEERARREERRDERWRERMAEETESLALRLDLHPTQSAALQRAVELRADARRTWFEARRNGQSSSVDPDSVFRDELATFLTDEQLAAYDEYESSVSQGRAETGATARMNSLAPELGLTEEQKDAVFATFYEDLVTRQNSGWSSSEDRDAALATSMQSILSADQYERWQTLESRDNFFRFGGPPR